MRLGLGMVLSAITLQALASDAPADKRQIEIRITAPTMVAALIQFTEQTGLQLVFPTDGATDIAARKVEGSLTPRAALEQLLQNSGLRFEFVNAHTVLVTARPAQGGAPTTSGLSNSAQ